MIKVCDQRLHATRAVHCTVKPCNAGNGDDAVKTVMLGLDPWLSGLESPPMQKNRASIAFASILKKRDTNRHRFKQRLDVDGPNKSGHDEKKETPRKIVMAALVAAIHESTLQPEPDSRGLDPSIQESVPRPRPDSHTFDPSCLNSTFTKRVLHGAA